MGWEQKGGRKGVGEGKEGNACPQTPQFWKTPTGFHGWVHLLIDNFVTELKSQWCYMYLQTRLEGNKSNVCLRTSLSYGLSLTVHLLDGHFMLLKKNLPAFSLICDFGKQNTRGNVSKFPSALRVIDRSDRNPPIIATSVTFWPSLRHASGLWLVDFDPICR